MEVAFLGHFNAQNYNKAPEIGAWGFRGAEGTAKLFSPYALHILEFFGTARERVELQGPGSKVILNTPASSKFFFDSILKSFLTV